MPAHISVCIPTIRPTTLGYAVRSVLNQDFAEWDLVVVGQGDEALLRGATEEAANGDKRVRYLHLERRGASAARNAGFEVTSGEIVAFLDDDCEAQHGWLASIEDCFRSDVGLVGGTVDAPLPLKRRFKICPSVIPDEVVTSSDDAEPPPGFGFLGANLAVRRDAAKPIRFDECLGPGSRFGGGEEHDYVRRLAQLGVRLRSTPRAVVTHTFGYRYGIRAVYAQRRDRVRGDGAMAAKQTLMRMPEDHLPVWRCLFREAKSQLTTISPMRLPQNVFRLFHYLKSYRECLVGYELSSAAYLDPPTAVLIAR
jgi:glycosyltransferase involved in cell wall biosynthesis